MSGPNGLSAADLAAIRSHFARGEKIAAIKLYRERTGVGLAEARDAVEALARGEAPPAVPSPPPPPAGVDLARVQTLLRAGQVMEAIKHYREATGLGLKEAKDAVDAIAAATPGSPPSPAAGDYRGCVNVLLVVVVFALCLFGGCGTVAQTTSTYRCALRTVKSDPDLLRRLGGEVGAGYLVLAPAYSQSWDLDGSWRRSMELFMPAWGSRGVGVLYVSARDSEGGYAVMRATLFKDLQRYVVQTWTPLECS